MEKKKATRNSPKQHNLRPCYVDVTKLSLNAISRMIINPLYISNRCGRCDQIAYYSPKCTTCSVPYHYQCALLRKRCCGFPILFHNEKSTQSECFKCKKPVSFGPYCSVCHSRFHSYCITPFDQCCRVNLYNFPQRQCAKCEQIVSIGPKCPICRNTYHTNCLGSEFQCCDLKFPLKEDDYYYRCGKCYKTVGLGCLLCQFCGEIYHTYCQRTNRTCCGQPISFEVLFIPSFTRATNHIKNVLKWRSKLKQREEIVVNHSHSLRSMTKKVETTLRKRKKSVSSQTYALDSVTIVSVKTESDDKEMDNSDLPPVLEREICSPEPSSSSSHLQNPDSNSDSDDTLRNLFDFLYNMVKKFPPQLQTQVKIDLFKTVTEAEMKLQCNVFEAGSQSNRK